jgi:hypothetical protein
MYTLLSFSSPFSLESMIVLLRLCLLTQVSQYSKDGNTEHSHHSISGTSMLDYLKIRMGSLILCVTPAAMSQRIFRNIRGEA